MSVIQNWNIQGPEGSFSHFDSGAIYFNTTPNALIQFDPPLDKGAEVLVVGFYAKNCNAEEVKVVSSFESISVAKAYVGVAVMDTSSGALINMPGTSTPWLTQTTGSNGEHQNVYPSFSDQSIRLWPGPTTKQGYVPLQFPLVLIRNMAEQSIREGRLSITTINQGSVTFDAFSLDLRIVRQRGPSSKVYDPRSTTNSALTNRF